MSKKKWNRKVELGGATPNDYLTQLEDYRLGRVSASDVRVENVPVEEPRQEHPTITIPYYHNENPNVDTDVRYHIPMPDENKKKKKKDKGPSYRPGEPIIPFGDKKAKFTNNPYADIPGLTSDFAGVQYHVPDPYYFDRPISNVAVPDVVQIEGADGKVYNYDTRTNKIVGIVGITSPDPEPEPESDEGENFMSQIFSDMGHFSGIDDNGFVEDIPRPESDIEEPVLEEDDNEIPQFVVEGELAEGDDGTTYLTIGDANHVYTVKSSYVDLFGFDNDEFVAYVKKHNLPEDFSTIINMAKLIMSLILTTRLPAIATTSDEEFIAGLNMYSNINDVGFPRATINNTYMLWCAADSFINAINNGAMKYAGIHTIMDANIEYLKYFLVVLKESMRMNNAWNCYGSEIKTEGFPKEVDIFISKDRETTPIQSFDAPNDISKTIVDYNKYISLREYLTDNLLINEDDEAVDDGVMDMLENLPQEPEVEEEEEVVDSENINIDDFLVEPEPKPEPKNFVEMTKKADEVKPETKVHPKTREVPERYEIVVNDSNHSNCVPAKSVEGEFVVPIIKRR